MSDTFQYQAEIVCKDSLYVVPFIGDVDVTYAMLKVASNVEGNSKPVYLSLLMNEKQLLSIVNNKHLFDSEMIAAAYSLLYEYERANVS